MKYIFLYFLLIGGFTFGQKIHFKGFASRHIFETGKIYFSVNDFSFSEEKFFELGSDSKFNFIIDSKDFNNVEIESIHFVPDLHQDFESSALCIQSLDIQKIVESGKFGTKKEITLNYDILPKMNCWLSIADFGVTGEEKELVGIYKLNYENSDITLTVTDENEVEGVLAKENDKYLTHLSGGWTYNTSSKIFYLNLGNYFNPLYGITLKHRVQLKFTVSKESGVLKFKEQSELGTLVKLE